MRKILILLTLVLTLSLTNVLADIRVPGEPYDPPPRHNPTPVKEEKPAGFCYGPTIIAGALFSLALISLGLRVMRYRQTPLTVKEIAG